MVRRGDIAREVALVASLTTRDDIVQPLGAWLGAARGPGVALPFEDRVSLTDHAGGGKGACTIRTARRSSRPESRQF